MEWTDRRFFIVLNSIAPMISRPQPPTSILFRCEGTIDPFTGAVEVRRVDCERMPEMEDVLRSRLQSLRRWTISLSKVRTLLLLVVLVTLLAAIYGALHNQLSFTVAPEYFTKYKFLELGIDPARFGGERQAAAFVGALSSWWVGFGAAVLLGLIGMIHPERKMFRRVFRALTFVLAIAVVFGLLGLGIGELVVRFDLTPKVPSDFGLTSRFFVAEWMHAFSYLGGGVGLLAGIVDLRRIGRVVSRREDGDEGASAE